MSQTTSYNEVWYESIGGLSSEPQRIPTFTEIYWTPLTTAYSIFSQNADKWLEVLQQKVLWNFKATKIKALFIKDLLFVKHYIRHLNQWSHWIITKPCKGGVFSCIPRTLKQRFACRNFLCVEGGEWGRLDKHLWGSKGYRTGQRERTSWRQRDVAATAVALAHPSSSGVILL